MITNTQTTPAPEHLSAETKAWWKEITGSYELESHHLRLLQTACESWDRMCDARNVLNDQGATFTDRFGQPKPRPEVAIEKDSRISFQRSLRELSLDVDSGPSEPRLPRGGRYRGAVN